ncbi:hypothetical protein CLAIMM_07072 [Cladophialophora immunda]|nr:hypothetical protein CLAIMM_07072 [Cladophialophora immunda]
MNKEDFQYMGDHHQITDGAQYPAQTVEGNGQLVDHSLESPSCKEAEKWEYTERPTINHGQTKSINGSAPWHALAAVKKEEVPKKPVN